MKSLPWYLLDEVGRRDACHFESEQEWLFIPTVSETDLDF